MRLFHITVFLTCLIFNQASLADSKRIEVYPLAENYYDTQPGDSLSTIAARLLPNNPNLRQGLEKSILKQNPGAFIDGKPDRLLAGKRLQLPTYLTKPDTPATQHIIVETYSWGNIKRPVAGSK